MIKNFVVLLLLISATTQYEDIEGRTKRYKFYSDIRKFSNYTLDVAVDPYNGLYCQARDFIEIGQRTLRVPSSHAMCPYYIFPFKFELVEILESAPGLKESLGREQKFSVFLLTYNIMYQLHSNKKFLTEYLENKKLTHYQNLEFKSIEGIENSFPKIILGKSTLDPEHFKLMADKGLVAEIGGELHGIFKHVLNKINQHEHMEGMFHWTSNFDHFRHAYGVVMSRGMTLRLNEYYTLVEKRKENQIILHLKRKI